MVRILPALVACLLVTLLASCLLIPSAWLSKANDLTGLSAFVGLSNVALLLYDDGYFAPKTDYNPFTHTWSLGVEEQFYLLFPWVFLFWRRCAGRPGVVGHLAGLCLPLLLSLSLGIGAIESATHPDRAFYLLHNRFWELAAGALLFQAHTRGSCIPNRQWMRDGCLLVGLGLLGVGFLFGRPEHFPLPWALCPVVGTVLALAAVAKSGSRASGPTRLLGSEPSAYVGRISYSLYLWHWPVLVLLRWTVGLSAWTLVAGMLLTLLLAVGSYHAIERPIRSWYQTRGTGSRRVVPLGLLSASLALGLGYVLTLAQPYISLSVTRDRAAWDPVGWVPEGPAARRLEGARLFVVGDSHAAMYRSMLRALRGLQGLDFEIHWRSGCGIADLREPSASNPMCGDHPSRARAHLQRELRPDDVVLLASARMERLVSSFGSRTARSRRDPNSPAVLDERARAFEEAREWVAVMVSRTPHVIIEAPKPVFLAPAFRCADVFNRSNPACAAGLTMDRETLLEMRRPTMDAIRRLQEEFPQLVVWDPFPVLCPESPCSAFDGDLPLFSDGDHLSGHGNAVLYEDLLSLLTRVTGRGHGARPVGPSLTTGTPDARKAPSRAPDVFQ